MPTINLNFKQSIIRSLTVLLMPVSYCIRFKVFWNIFNFIYESINIWTIHNIVVKCIAIPKQNNQWNIKLVNGKSVKTLIQANSDRTWQVPLSYKWHAPSLNLLELILDEFYDRSSYYIDIGANAGLRSLLFLSASRPTIMIEPNSDVNKLNRNRAILNNFSNYEIIEKGVSSKNQKLDFYIDKSSYLSSFDPNNIDKELFDSHQLVPTTTLDTLLQLKGISSEFIAKIDVEGHEWEVIEGARESIKKLCPSLIIEINKKGDHIRRIFNYFSNEQYEIYSIARRPSKEKMLLKICSDLESNNNFLSNDFLFVKNPGLTKILGQYLIG